MRLLPVDACERANHYFCSAFLSQNHKEIESALKDHVTLVVYSVALGFALALPLAVAVRNHRRSRAAALTFAGILYTIPSLAAFALLVPFLGVTHITVPLIVLSAYNLLVLLRNVLVGLDGVPPEVREAAIGLGYGRIRLLVKVELPLALPALIAGLRIATVSTIGLTTVAGVIGFGGLGQLLTEGEENNFFHAEIMTALLLCVALAIISDVVLLTVQKALMPWARRRRGAA